MVSLWHKGTCWSWLFYRILWLADITGFKVGSFFYKLESCGWFRRILLKGTLMLFLIIIKLYLKHVINVHFSAQ